MSKLFRRDSGWIFALVAAAALWIVLVTYARTWIPGYGLTRMIPIGWEFNQRGIPAYRATPKYIPPDRWGFDGQLYAELSLDPLLRDPGIRGALDNPTYRAHRILLSWLAWIGGFGRPFWVLNVYAALNGVFWLGYLLILWKLFRPLGWPGALGFAAMLLTCGVVESMDRTLTDFPAFVFLILAAMAGGRKGAFWLALSGLTREVNLLGFLGLVEFRRPWGKWALNLLVMGLIAALPPLAWFAYVAARFPGNAPMVGGNLDLPLHAIYLRLQEVAAAGHRGGLAWADLWHRGTETHVLLTIIATVTQCVYVLSHPRWGDRLWRMGAVFVPFFLCVSMNVWGGFGYFTVTRHALPITLAFNLVLARRPSRAWLAWFILGNCFVPAAVTDFIAFGRQMPRQLELTIDGPAAAHDAISARYLEGWSGMEKDERRAWHWMVKDRAELALVNQSKAPIEADLEFDALSVKARDLRVTTAGRTLWLGWVPPKPASTPVRTLRFSLAPGQTVVSFATAQPVAPPGTNDPRTLGVMVAGLTLRVLSAP